MRPYAKQLIAAISVVMWQMPAFSSVPNDIAGKDSGAFRFGTLVETAPALAPMGHVVFCYKNPDECSRPEEMIRSVKLDTHTFFTLARINSSVNASIVPRNDQRKNGLGDQWTLQPAAGDCEDYALTKRHQLIALGIPQTALRLAVGRSRSGVGHTVLIVRTEQGDVVLDNRTNRIRAVHAADLTWIAMQSAADPRFWSAVRYAGQVES